MDVLPDENEGQRSRKEGGKAKERHYIPEHGLGGGGGVRHFVRPSKKNAEKKSRAHVKAKSQRRKQPSAETKPT